MVVRAGHPNPEAAIKVINMQIDMTRLNYGFEGFECPEDKPYCVIMPINFHLDYPNAVERVYINVSAVLAGDAPIDVLTGDQQASLPNVQAEIDDHKADVNNWAVKMAWLDGAGMTTMDIIDVRPIVEAARVVPNDPRWTTLTTMEDEAFLLIITGQQPIDYFDTFVQQWLDAGGAEITAQIEAASQ
jgi:putative aldouronate transport system substrate-binding protein